MISSTSSLASSTPATSLNVTLFWCSLSSLAFDLPKRHRLAAARLQLAHEEEEDADEEQHRQPPHEHLRPEARLILGLDGVRDAGAVDIVDDGAGELGVDDPLRRIALHRDDVARVVMAARLGADTLDLAGLLLVGEARAERGDVQFPLLARGVREHRVDAHEHEDQEWPRSGWSCGIGAKENLRVGGNLPCSMEPLRMDAKANHVKNSPSIEEVQRRSGASSGDSSCAARRARPTRWHRS